MNSGQERRLLHGILQCFARRELGHLLRLDLDCLSCLGVASRSSGALGYLEGPEPNNGHVNALLQRLGDGRENSVNSTRSLLLRTGKLLDFLDQIRLVDVPLLFGLIH
jgi:hypothetical protein